MPEITIVGAGATGCTLALLTNANGFEILKMLAAHERKEHFRIVMISGGDDNLLAAAGREQLRAAEDAAIREVVNFQEDLGFKVITDGEYRRHSTWKSR